MLCRFCRPASRRRPAPIGVGFVATVLLVAIFCSTAPLSIAHEDQDAAGTPAASTWPRVSAQSETYELVGILKGERLTIYVDQFGTNGPVSEAIVKVAIGDNEAISADPAADGTYSVSSPRLVGPGPINIAFSVSAETGDDALMGTLQWPQQALVATAGSSPATPPWLRWAAAPGSVQNPALWGLISFVLGVLAGHFFRSGRLVPAAATATTCVVVLLIGTVLGHGHDNGSATSAPGVGAAMSDAPRRLPDGDVFLAKPTQRLLDVRTILLKPEAAQRAISLIGRVIVDPNRTSLVQSISGGRVVAPNGGLPHIGQVVATGDVLAEIERALPQADRTTISEKAGEIEQFIAVTEAKLKRLRPLAARGVSMQSLVIEAETELEGLRRRREVIREARLEPEILRAPTSGVIAVAKVLPGQVVQAQDIMFQIVDPKGYLVEALVYGEVAPASLVDATAVGLDEQPVPLLYQGFSRTLQQHAAVVHFAIPAPAGNLNIGQPVTVVAKIGAATSGLLLPREAVVRSPNGEAIVWYHEEPEGFEPRPVRTQPVDATRLMIAVGVKEGERIVIRGADLVNQIR